MNVDAVEATAQLLQLPERLDNIEEANKYTDYLVNFTQNLLEATVPWGKVSERAEPWWTKAVADAVEKEREAKRKALRTGAEEDWQEEERARKDKRRIIHEAKQRNFRKVMKELTDDQESIWKLAEWGRTKAQKPPELPTMPLS